MLFQPISLVLLDIEAMMGVLKGVVMELIDCALPLLTGESPVGLYPGVGEVIILDMCRPQYECLTRDLAEFT